MGLNIALENMKGVLGTVGLLRWNSHLPAQVP